MTSPNALRISAFIGFLAVAFGAFGAHGLAKVPVEQLEWWKTGALYHLIHAVVLLVLALNAPLRVWAWRLFLAGIVVFSGSLYLMGLTGIRWLGAITPIGGLCFLAGWLVLAMGKTNRE